MMKVVGPQAKVSDDLLKGLRYIQERRNCNLLGSGLSRETCCCLQTCTHKMEEHKPEEYVELRVDDKTTVKMEEHFDVLDEKGNLTGKTKAR